ncbi:gustatory receptor 68a-like [Homalodisca vitripennis]|uniref:gustatory receptor 68a-like n=1 Tax=Homalodisca vitripennis TaxID=197043 RepID=UPI001EEC4D8B|nr:gustatory receptor 68a-like [Homalodisca vitripennis]
MAVLGLYTDYGENHAGHPVRMFSYNTTLVVLLDIVSLSLLLPVVLLSCSRKDRLFLKVLDILDKVEQNLQQDLPDRKAKVKMFLVCTVIMTLIVCNGALDFTSSLSTGRLNHMRSLCYIPAQFMYFAQAALFLHFTKITESIALRFRTINGEIKEALLGNRSERIVLRESPRINVSESVGGVSSICKVKSLMDTYWMLCEAVQKANIFYGGQLLVTFLSSFFQTTIALYYFFFFVINGFAMAATFGGAWIIAQVAHLVLLTRPSTLVTEMADDTAPMICKLINMDLDPTLVELLEGILMQLRKHNARFTALGFFQIHNSTLTAMAGAVTTYLVVLIQMRILYS